MAMNRTAAPASPDAYVRSLRGWRRGCVEELRSAAMAMVSLHEVVKWGHLVYLANGPVCLIRAEARRVLFGFWRGQRLRAMEPRLKPGGKYEMATVEILEATPLERETVAALIRAAVALNASLGDPTKLTSSNG